MGESICKTLDTKRNPEHIENAYNSESISLRRQQAKELNRSSPVTMHEWSVNPRGLASSVHREIQTKKTGDTHTLELRKLKRLKMPSHAVDTERPEMLQVPYDDVK